MVAVGYVIGKYPLREGKNYSDRIFGHLLAEGFSSSGMEFFTKEVDW